MTPSLSKRSLRKIILPDTVTEIGSYAFNDCQMSEIRLSEGLTGIGDHAFEYCYFLTQIDLPDSLTDDPLDAPRAETSLDGEPDNGSDI